MAFHCGPHGILEEFKEHVVEVGGDVDHVNGLGGVGGIDFLDLQVRGSHVILVTQELSHVVGIFHHIRHAAVGINAANVFGVGWVGAAIKDEGVLVNEHADRDAAEVEAVQKYWMFWLETGSSP